MIPKPEYIWEYTGSFPFSVYGLTEQQLNIIPNNYKGFEKFIFKGVGWYSEYKILIEKISDDRYRISKYSKDPRKEFLAASNLPVID